MWNLDVVCAPADLVGTKEVQSIATDTKARLIQASIQMCNCYKFATVTNMTLLQTHPRYKCASDTNAKPIQTCLWYKHTNDTNVPPIQMFQLYKHATDTDIPMIQTCHRHNRIQTCNIKQLKHYVWYAMKKSATDTRDFYLVGFYFANSRSSSKKVLMTTSNLFWKLIYIYINLC